LGLGTWHANLPHDASAGKIGSFRSSSAHNLPISPPLRTSVRF
jgi:hypothetical protein